mgnify:CR=1 FL=1
MVTVPGEGLGRRLREAARRRSQRGAVQAVVVPTVVEIGLKTATHREAPLLVHGHVAKVEQAVDVGAQQQAVGGLVRNALAEGPDVGGVEDRQRALARDGATALVAGSDGETEGAPSQPGLYQARCTQSRPLRCRGRRHGHALGHCRPEIPSVGLAGAVARAGHDVACGSWPAPAAKPHAARRRAGRGCGNRWRGPAADRAAPGPCGSERCARASRQG